MVDSGHKDWYPDYVVTEAVVAGRMTYSMLSFDEQRWVVADLTERGHSVTEISVWLRCSPRQVKRLRAELVTQVMMAWIRMEKRYRECVVMRTKR